MSSSRGISLGHALVPGRDWVRGDPAIHVSRIRRCAPATSIPIGLGKRVSPTSSAVASEAVCAVLWVCTCGCCVLPAHRHEGMLLLWRCDGRVLSCPCMRRGNRFRAAGVGQGGGARGASVGWDAVPTLSDCYALCVECVLSLVLTSIFSDAPSRRVCGCGFAPAPAGLGWGGHARPAVGVSAAAVRLFSCAAAQRGQPRDGCAKEARNRR